MGLDVADLVVGPDGFGTPWSAMHCGQLAAEVLRRAGVPTAALEALARPGVADDIQRLEEATGGGWRCVGSSSEAATRVGDVLVSPSLSGPSSLHLSVLVRAGISPKAITTTEASGARVVRRSSVADVQAVYRWEPKT